jgi:hypothetical protein
MAPTLDLFKYQTMLRVLETAKKPKTFLRNNFFSTVEQSMTEQVLIDVVEGKRRTAVYVKPKHAAKVVDRIGYKTNAYTPPYVKMKMDCRAEDFLTRMPGETIFGGGDTPMARAAKRVGEDLITMNDMIDRLEEYQAAQLIQTGAYNIVGDGVDEVIDFVLPGSHNITLTGADRWTESTGTPIDDLRTWKRLIAKDSGETATDVIFGESVVEAFLANAQVKDYFDRLHINNGTLTAEADYGAEGSGVTFIGRIQSLGLNIWAYDEWYIDPASGTETAMINNENVIMLAKNMRSSRTYGAIRDLKANFAVPRFPKSWEEEDPSVRWLMVQSAPMLALHNTASILVADVTEGGP